MFEFPLLDEDARQELREMEAQRSIYRRKEALQVYDTLSCDFRDAFSELEIFVLKPLRELRKPAGYRLVFVE